MDNNYTAENTRNKQNSGKKKYGLGHDSSLEKTEAELDVKERAGRKEEEMLPKEGRSQQHP